MVMDKHHRKKIGKGERVFVHEEEKSYYNDWLVRSLTATPLALFNVFCLFRNNKFLSFTFFEQIFVYCQNLSGLIFKFSFFLSAATTLSLFFLMLLLLLVRSLNWIYFSWRVLLDLRASPFFFCTTIADSVLSYNGRYGCINAIEYARFPFVFVCIAIVDGSVIFFIRFIEIS